MEEPVIIDKEAQTTSKYFKRSKALYRYSAYTFLWIILYTQIGKAVGLNGVMDALFVAIPALALYIITPLGIFYAIKSYAVKEPYYKYRAFYLFGHLFFLFILLVLLFSVYSDLLRFS